MKALIFMPYRTESVKIPTIIIAFAMVKEDFIANLQVSGIRA